LNNAIAEHKAPPIFEVRPPQLQADDDRKRFSGLGVRVNRRRDSGLLEIQFNGNENLKIADPAKTAMAIAREEDPDREFLELRRGYDESQFLVSRTLIPESGVKAPIFRIPWVPDRRA
jgi:hypothetical protein